MDNLRFAIKISTPSMYPCRKYKRMIWLTIYKTNDDYKTIKLLSNSSTWPCENPWHFSRCGTAGHLVNVDISKGISPTWPQFLPWLYFPHRFNPIFFTILANFTLYFSLYFYIFENCSVFFNLFNISPTNLFVLLSYFS